MVAATACAVTAAIGSLRVRLLLLLLLLRGGMVGGCEYAREVVGSESARG